MKSKKISTKRIVLAALMAALTVVGSTLRITLPVSVMGTTSFHLGNIFCALSGILLGPGLGGLAAGMGSAIYDMFNPLYIAECWITFLMKGAYGLVTASGQNIPLTYSGFGVAVAGLMYLVLAAFFKFFQ